jgi:ubiquitin carboxyl-terminal hydrolase 4/11/15
VPPQPLPKAFAPSSPTPSASSAPGPLIRLGEGIVVDWYDEAWTRAFGSSGQLVDLRGAKTWRAPAKLHDAALELRQRRRTSRRKNGITLDECLDEFEKAEVLSAQDMWYCPRCKDHRRASKKFDLWKSPDILVCHLKRFSANRRDKLDVPVEFPVFGLDLTRRVVNPEDGKDEVYDLIAVDDHFGGLGGGHYTAYARNFVDRQWYDYNGE